MKDSYESPLCTRYASKEMRGIFSPDHKYSTWRTLWCTLAESERELGLPITLEQTEELRENVDNIDYQLEARYERELRHDVMAHLHTYADACPKAGPIIHLGATSAFVGDNTDIIVMREALVRIKELLVNAIAALGNFAQANKDVPTLAYTHFQAAQPTTAGKRATLWLQDLLMDYERLEHELSQLKLLGCKGATGTCASFLELFDGDMGKLKALEKLISDKMGFKECMAVSGQTYSRKVDAFVLNVLSAIAQSCAKLATDLRLLCHMKEFDEPFESAQVGSSAMAYKRNPMRCERVVALARYIINDSGNAADTAAAQWLERTLDDSANRRISIPEAFLAADGMLTLVINIIYGGQIYPKVMEKHLNEELPFIASENILMDAVKRGGDRQALHEKIRQYSQQAAARVKLEGLDNNLTELLLSDEAFGLTSEGLAQLMDVRKFIGCAPEQTEEFIDAYVKPLLEANRYLLGTDSAIEL